MTKLPCIIDTEYHVSDIELLKYYSYYKIKLNITLSTKTTL